MTPRRLLAWWVGELAALVPSRLRRRRARLMLPAERVLVRELSLPLAAEGDLRAVLAFEMDRFTPFKADEVLFDAVIRARDPGAGRLSVLLVAARREAVAAALAGGSPAGIGVAGLPDAIDLLPRRSRRPDRATVLLAGLCLVLAVASVALPFHRQQQQLDRLRGTVAALRSAAAEADAIRGEIAAGLEAEAVPLAARAQRPTALAAVEALSALLPDDAWVSVLTLSPEGIEFGGQAASADRLLHALEESPLFAAALFRAPVDQDGRSGRERFALAAKWEGP